MSPLKYILKSLGLVGLLLVVFYAGAAAADAVPAGTDDEIRARLTPFGNLCRAGDDCGAGGDSSAVAGSAAKSGEDVYGQFCFACHATGVSEAPLFADAEAWAPRIDKGMEVMMASTRNGLGMMPPMGTCMACSDAELQAAIDYMLESNQ